MNILNILKGAFAISLIFSFATLALATSLFLPLASILLPYLGPIWLGLGILAAPVFLFISLKLLAWIDLLFDEVSLNLHLRTQFVKARNKMTKNLPKWVRVTVNFVT